MTLRTKLLQGRSLIRFGNRYEGLCQLIERCAAGVVGGSRFHPGVVEVVASSLECSVKLPPIVKGPRIGARALVNGFKGLHEILFLPHFPFSLNNGAGCSFVLVELAIEPEE